MDEQRDLERYLEVLAGSEPQGRLIEIRFRCEVGMGQVFVGAERSYRAADVIRGLARRRDTFIGVLLRDRRAGGRDAVSRAHLVWVELDARSSEQLLERAPAPPSVRIASGTPGHLHAYWLLDRAVPADEAQAANRKLALHLSGDLGSVDAPRVLRPPQSLNHKHQPPRPVELLSLDPTRTYDIGRLTAGLLDPRPATPVPAHAATETVVRGLRSRRGDAVYEQLRAIPTVEYVRRLTGREPNREGKVLCVFHEERTPSMQTYPDGSWCCFGCGRGGSIVDFASGLWGIGTKGRDFLRLRDRLADELLAPTRPERGQAHHDAPLIASRRQKTTTEELAR